MRALTYTRRSEPGKHFYRCAVCGEHVEWRGTAVFVQVGNEVQAVVCEGSCAAAARLRVAQALPGAFPDLNDRGELIE